MFFFSKVRVLRVVVVVVVDVDGLVAILAACNESRVYQYII